MKNLETKIPQIFLGAYALLCIPVIASSYIEDEISLKLKGSLLLLLLLAFMLGVILSWFREKVAGLLLMVWNVCIWINELFIDKTGGGMGILLAFPALVLAAFMLLQRYERTGKPEPSMPQQWKFALRILLFNSAILYAIYMIQDILFGNMISFYHLPGIANPFLLVLFLMGFGLSWKYELYAGIAFIIWYGVALSSSIRYFEISNRGPIAVIGFLILVQGILHISYYFRFRAKSHDN